MNRKKVRIIHIITAILLAWCLTVPFFAQVSLAEGEDVWNVDNSAAAGEEYVGTMPELTDAPAQQPTAEGAPAGAETAGESPDNLQTYLEGDRYWVYLPTVPGNITDVVTRIDTAVDVASEVADVGNVSGSGIRTVILFDNSGSIAEYNRDKFRQAAKEIIAQHRAGEVFTLCTFDSGIHELAAESADYDALAAQIDAITFNDQETWTNDVLYDAYFQYGVPDSRYLRFVMLSDGENNHPEGHTRDEIKSLYANGGVPFYGIGSIYAADADALNNLFDVSDACGVSHYLVDEMEDMSLIGSQISADAPGKITFIKLPPEVQDGSVKPLRITVNTDQGTNYQYLLEKQMPVGDTSARPAEPQPVVQETAAETETAEAETQTEAAEAETTDPDETILGFLGKDSFIPGISWLIVIIAAAVIIAVVIVLVILLTRSRNRGYQDGRSRNKHSRLEEPMSRDGYPDFTRENAPGRRPSGARYDAGYDQDPWSSPEMQADPERFAEQQADEPRRPARNPWGDDRYHQPAQEPGDSTMSLSSYDDEKTVLLNCKADRVLILIKEGDENNKIERAVHSGMTIGRRPGCDICLADDKSVSGLHCTITLREDALFLRDENSSNGTYLNNTKLTGERRIQTGDILEIGRNRYHVQIR